MTMVATCTACGKAYRVPDTMAGKRVKCKACGGAFQVPPPQAPPEEDAPPDWGAVEYAAQAAPPAPAIIVDTAVSPGLPTIGTRTAGWWARIPFWARMVGAAAVLIGVAALGEAPANLSMIVFLLAGVVLISWGYLIGAGLAFGESHVRGVRYLFNPYVTVLFLLIHWSQTRRARRLATCGLGLLLLSAVAGGFAASHRRQRFVAEADERMRRPWSVPSSPGLRGGPGGAPRGWTDPNGPEAMRGRMSESEAEFDRKMKAAAATRPATQHRKPSDSP